MQSSENDSNKYVSENDSDESFFDNKCMECNCERSMCLKMYCQCFTAGRYCSNCNCVNCRNLQGNVHLKTKIIELNKGEGKYWHEAIEKEGLKFSRTNIDNKMFKGCHCTKSKCLKGYCDCFNIGRYCTDFCKCISCCNKVEETKTTTSYKKQNTHRIKNYIKSNNQTEKDLSNSRLNFVFLPAGNLYSYIYKHSSKSTSSENETSSFLINKLMTTLHPKEPKHEIFSDTNEMINHYCGQDHNESTKQDDKLLEKRFKSPSPFLSKDKDASTNVSYIDRTMEDSGYKYDSTYDLHKTFGYDAPIINSTSLLAESKIKTHLIIDEFMKNINPGLLVNKKVKVH